MKPFPREIAGQSFPDAPSLARTVQEDAAAGGGRVVSGERPAVWLGRALRADEVERELIVGLSAALIRAARPASIVEAAQLASEHELVELAPVFAAALAGLDVGVLLHPDPRGENVSVEDALLRAWSVVEGGDPARVTQLLDRLRHAGLRAEELAVLAQHAGPDAIRARLPPILVEALPVEDVTSLARALARGGAAADAVCRSADPLTGAQRYAVWHAAVRLEPSLEVDDALRERWLAVAGHAPADEVH